MNRFLLTNRRKEGMTLEKFRYEWGVVHVAVMLTTPSAMRIFRRYVQGHAVHDVEPAALLFPLHEERWDGFGSLWFETLEEFASSLGEQDYAERAKPHDFSDPSMLLELTGEEVVVDDTPGSEVDAVKLVHFLRPKLSREEFAALWRDKHESTLLDASDGLAYRYVRSPSLDLGGTPFGGTAYGAGAFGTFGGIEELWFADRDAFERWGGDGSRRERLLASYDQFVEVEGSFSMLVQDRLGFASVVAPDGRSTVAWAEPGLEVRAATEPAHADRSWRR